MEIIESDDSKWQQSDIYPVRVEINDGNQLELWEIDPQPKQVQ